MEEFLSTIGAKIGAAIVGVLTVIVTPLIMRWRKKAKNKINRWE